MKTKERFENSVHRATLARAEFNQARLGEDGLNSELRALEHEADALAIQEYFEHWKKAGSPGPFREFLLLILNKL